MESLAQRATMGAAPVPVPPPIPAVTNTSSALATTWRESKQANEGMGFGRGEGWLAAPIRRARRGGEIQFAPGGGKETASGRPFREFELFFRTFSMISLLSSAALWPTLGLPPAPSPRVILEPIWMRVAARLFCSTCGKAEQEEISRIGESGSCRRRRAGGCQKTGPSCPSPRGRAVWRGGGEAADAAHPPTNIHILGKGM